MEKKINKLVVPLTIKSMSLLGAMTIMATSIGGCASKKKNKEEETKTTIVTTSDEEIKTTSNIEITITTIPSETTVPTTTEMLNNNEVTTTKNITTKKTNQTKPKTNNNQSSNTTTNNQSSSGATTSSQNKNSNYENFVPLTKDNINNIEIFKRAVEEVGIESKPAGVLIWEYYYNDKSYRRYHIPTEEQTYLLAVLNQEYLTEETLNTLLGSYSEDDMKRCIHIASLFPEFIQETGCINNWGGVILDSNIKKQFNDIEKGFLEYLNNNPKPLKELLENYDYNNNPLVGYYLVESCIVANYYSDLEDSDFVNKYNDLYWDMKEACEKEASEMYNKIHGKTKVLE